MGVVSAFWNFCFCNHDKFFCPGLQVEMILTVAVMVPIVSFFG
ncbi:hypothetical Protein YC6258_02970 [Gynuella sunshinyii YC6258]|uniref:Uncharacterized protein n=1 Tax=Gynuella sunshinyii YC6258 TaxID=1445510 RepID=A0A0C5VNN4_9GAMM|nr:hypothetical Protein YC6258_02970 [Gynuella sunshinyii YC6258]